MELSKIKTKKINLLDHQIIIENKFEKELCNTEKEKKIKIIREKLIIMGDRG